MSRHRRSCGPPCSSCACAPASSRARQPCRCSAAAPGSSATCAECCLGAWGPGSSGPPSCGVEGRPQRQAGWHRYWRRTASLKGDRETAGVTERLTEAPKCLSRAVLPTSLSSTECIWRPSGRLKAVPTGLPHRAETSQKAHPFLRHTLFKCLPNLSYARDAFTQDALPPPRNPKCPIQYCYHRFKLSLSLKMPQTLADRMFNYFYPFSG